MPSYWIVGAMWDHEDQYQKFIRRGQWLLGWADKDQPHQAELRDQIKSGDRIAIKRMRGKGANTITILALGIVIDIDEEDKRIYVDWLIKDMYREVEARGCFAAIHGQYHRDDEWVKTIFCI